MNYEEKYKEALTYVKNLVEHNVISAENASKCFPEIAESEDEKIRKELIAYLDVQEAIIDKDDPNFKRWIAWLKKQGKKANPYSGISFEYNGHTWGMCARDHGVDILLDKQLFTHLEKQGEERVIGREEDWNISRRLEIENAAMSATGIIERQEWFIKGAEWSDEHPSCFQIKKKHEQNLTDKVDPKFKVGDWVIDKQGIVHQIANVVEIAASHTYDYVTVGGGYFNDNTEGVRRWTVEDAKDGDVLVSFYNKPFIYNGRFIASSVGAYCGLNLCDELVEEDFATSTWTRKDGVKPATKEQRVLLFAKMKEAGYEWEGHTKKLVCK